MYSFRNGTDVNVVYMQIIVLSLFVADDRFSWRFIYKNILFFMIWQGSLKVYPRVLFGQNFAIRTVSTETVINRVFFFSWQSANWMETSLVWVPYNKLLNKLAFSSCTKKYWPSVCTVMSSSRYSQYGLRAGFLRR